MKNYANRLDVKGTCQYVFPSANCKAGRRSRWHVAASLRDALSWPPKSVKRWDGGNGRPPWPQDWPDGGRLSCSWRQGPPNPLWRRRSACNARWSATGPSGFSPSAWMTWRTPLAVEPKKGYGHCYDRTWQREFLTFLEALDAEVDEHIRTVHLVCGHASTRHGKEVRKWL